MIIKGKTYCRIFVAFITVFFMTILISMNAEAVRMSYGNWIMRPGEACVLNDQNYAGSTRISKYWWISGDTNVAIDGNGYTCTVSALQEGKTIVCCRTNAVQETTVYNPVTHTYDTYSNTFTRTVNYNIIVEGARTLSFDANGGKASQSKMTIYTYTEIGALPTAAREGYEFLGWYTAKTGGVKAESTDIYSVDKTLYAQWKKINFKITFDANGGKAGNNSITIKNGNKIGTLPTAKREGYLFAGWYTGKKGGNKVTADTKPVDDAVYYAWWTKVSVGVCSLNKPGVGFGQITVSYKSVMDALGYEVCYSQNSKMKKATKKNVTRTEVLLKNLKKGRTYYIKVRAYKKDSMNKKVYGSYSKVIKVKLPSTMLEQDEMTILAGQNEKCKLLGAKGKVSWSTNNKSVAAVSKKGVITAKKCGSAVITAKYKGKKYKCKVKVEAPGFAVSDMTLIKGQKKNAAFSGTTVSVTYKSNNPAVAAVDAKGNITAVGKGKTTIQAIVNKKIYTCTISVEAPYLNFTSKTLNAGEGFKLTLHGTTLPVTWKSTNSSVASVSSNGTVSALKKGSASIVATVNGLSYTCELVVQQLVPGSLASPYHASEEQVVWVYKDGTCKGNYTIAIDSQSMYFEGDILKLELEFSITSEGGTSNKVTNETGYAKDIIDLSRGVYDSTGKNISINLISNDTLEQELTKYETKTFRLELELQGIPEGTVIYRIPTDYNTTTKAYTYTYFQID